MKNPLVSIIIAAYNSEKFIADALESVYDQTYTNYEVIIVDDGSTDGTAAALAPWRDSITLIQKKNGGISSARNAGIAHAKGEFFAILDADDVWLPTKLAEQVAFAQNNTSAGIIFSLAQNVLHKDLINKSNVSTNPFPIIAAHIPGNCMIKRDAFETIGYFNETVILGEFAEWYGRALNLGIGIGCVSSLLLLRRIHGENIGIKQKHHFNDYLHILKKKIDSQHSLQKAPH